MITTVALCAACALGSADLAPAAPFVPMYDGVVAEVHAQLILTRQGVRRLRAQIDDGAGDITVRFKFATEHYMCRALLEYVPDMPADYCDGDAP